MAKDPAEQKTRAVALAALKKLAGAKVNTAKLAAAVKELNSLKGDKDIDK